MMYYHSHTIYRKKATEISNEMSNDLTSSYHLDKLAPIHLQVVNCSKLAAQLTSRS